MRIVLIIGSMMMVLLSYGQPRGLTISGYYGNSKIHGLKERPGNNPYQGNSGEEWKLLNSARWGLGVHYQRGLGKRSSFAVGAGLRYARKGYNAEMYTWIPISIEDSYYTYRRYECGIDYIQLPITIEKRWAISRNNLALQLGLIPERNIYGYDNYDFLLKKRPRDLQYPVEKQKKYALSSLMKLDYRWALKGGDFISVGTFFEWQLTDYWDTGLTEAEQQQSLTDPDAPWGYFNHLIDTHLYNWGVEVGYTFGLKK